MNSILPFHLEERYKNECHPCCKGFDKLFRLPVGANFIPFQIALDGEFDSVSNTVDFFAVDGTLAYQRVLQLGTEICEGKTVITNTNREQIFEYEINTNSWVGVGPVVIDDVSKDAIIGVGGYIEMSPDGLPINSNIQYSVSVTNDNCPADGDYSIDLIDSFVTENLYTGNECKDHIFNINTDGVPRKIRITYLNTGQVDAITVYNSVLIKDLDPFIVDCFEGYARIELDTGIYAYSENFKAHNLDTLDECYIRIDYDKGCDECATPFQGYFYLPNGDESGANSSNAIAQYESEVVGDTDDEGNFIEESVKVWKVLNILATAAPEYFVDFLNYLQMYDITLTQFGRLYNIENFVEIETTWNLSGCFANVRLFLRVNTMKKIKCC